MRPLLRGNEGMGKYTLEVFPLRPTFVFEIRFNAPFNGDEPVSRYMAQFNLTLCDGKTRFVLRTMSAGRRSAPQGNLHQQCASRNRLADGCPRRTGRATRVTSPWPRRNGELATARARALVISSLPFSRLPSTCNAGNGNDPHFPVFFFWFSAKLRATSRLTTHGPR